MKMRSVDDILQSILGSRVVVIGDIMLDEYLHGSVTRINPEGPAPLISVEYLDYRVGGAANTAANIVSLRGICSLMGTIGNDTDASTLRQKIIGAGIDSVLITLQKTTTKKTRIIVGNQQMLRYDQEEKSSISAEDEVFIESVLNQTHADVIILVSDYAK